MKWNNFLFSCWCVVWTCLYVVHFPPLQKWKQSCRTVGMKRCAAILAVDHGIREILFYRCLGIKGIGQFAGHIVPPLQSFTSKSWKHKTRFWDLKRTSLHFENVFLATWGSSVRVWSMCVCNPSLSSASPKINTGPEKIRFVLHWV